MKRNSKMFLFIVMLLLTGSSCFLMTSCQKDYDGQLEIIRINPEKPDVPLNKNDAFQKVQKRHVQEKR